MAFSNHEKRYMTAGSYISDPEFLSTTVAGLQFQSKETPYIAVPTGTH